MIEVGRRTKKLLLGATAVAGLAIAPPVWAEAAPQARREFNLESQSLGPALRAVGKASGREIMFPAEIVEGKQAPRLQGRFTADEAIQMLLKRSGLTAEFRDDVVLIRGRSEPSGALADRPTDENLIVVTGSRIRGAPIASPVVTITQQQMLDAGHNTLADAVRNIPQNFGGGQNPGIGLNVPAGSGVNLGSASTINLRGLAGC